MIYLDNSATTRQYPEVTREMLRYMDEFYGNPSSLYQLGVDSEKAVKKARTALQKAIGCTLHQEVQKLTIWRYSERSGR